MLQERRPDDLRELVTRGRGGLVDPIDRIAEIIFGLIMAVTIVGALSVATAGQNEVRTVLLAALGCNLAWGLVDAVIYLVRTLTARTRVKALASAIIGADPAAARLALAAVLPEDVAAIVGDDEIEGMRQRLAALQDPPSGRLRLNDYLAAVGIFLLVVGATFPVVLPFMFARDITVAMEISRGITLVMLFLAGLALGRYASYQHPFRTGMVMLLLGAALITAVKALGG